MSGLSNSLNVSVQECTALHYPDSPAHGHALLMELEGYTKAALKKVQDDPVLTAYAIEDCVLPMATYIAKLMVWVRTMKTSTPDETVTNGARIC